jgi:hypothetical protein
LGYFVCVCAAARIPVDARMTRTTAKPKKYRACPRQKIKT